MMINTLPLVTLENKFHRGQHQILIRFDYNKTLINVVKSISGTCWSQRLKSWYIPNTLHHLETIKSKLSNHSSINDSALSQDIFRTKKNIKRKRNLSTDHRKLLLGYMLYLKGKRYSESTVNTYLTLTADLVEFYNGTDLQTLNNRSVEVFIEQVMVPKRYSISTHRQFISSLKHFKAYYPNCNIDDLHLVLPKKDKLLPTVLSKSEVIDIIRCTQNLKHRAIIALLYSCGLRIGELIQLKQHHIDIDRRQLIVKQGKGRKDRYVVLAESFLPLLLNYISTYQPKVYVFQGQKGGAYSTESIRKFLKKSCKNAQINKKVTPHTLRHSYATHLLESGIDIRYIQELLGHAKPETTMIYTHVSKKDMLQIKSPLDIALKEIATNGNSPTILLSQNL